MHGMKIFIFLALVYKVCPTATPFTRDKDGQGQDNPSVQQNFQTCSMSIHKCTHTRSFQKITADVFKQVCNLCIIGSRPSIVNCH